MNGRGQVQRTAWHPAGGRLAPAERRSLRAPHRPRDPVVGRGASLAALTVQRYRVAVGQAFPMLVKVNTEPEPSDLVRPRVLATDIASVTVAPECADLGLD